MATLKYLDPVTGEYKKIASGGGGTSIPASDTEPATGNYWLDTSEEGGTYYTAGEVDNMLAALPAGMQMDLLWENPDYAADFATQTVELDLSEYDMVFIQCNSTSALALIGRTAHLTASTSHTIFRSFNVSSTGVVIGDGKLVGTYGNSTYTTRNDLVRPYRIYGVKQTVTGGTPITPENVYTKDEIDALLANIGGGTSMNLLWTNPDPTAEFGAQHVYLDLSEYSLIFFRFLRFYRDGHNDGYQTVIGMKGKEMIATTAGAISSTQDSVANNAVAARRYINSTDEFVYFDPGVRDQASNSSSVDNRCMIPVEIYGIKTVAANSASEIEDPDHPGCFYRMVNGVQEWLNPPMELGVEYKTAERYLGKSVYVKTIECAITTAGTTTTIAHGIENIDRISRCDGRRGGYPLPDTYRSDSSWNCSIDGVDSTSIRIYAGSSISTGSQFICSIYYIKNTD